MAPQQRQPNPYDRVWFLNKYYHLYLTKFLMKAYRNKNLPIEEYYLTPKSEMVNVMYPKFQRCYAKVRNKKNSVQKASLKFCKVLLTMGCLLLFLESCLSAVSAFLVGEILREVHEMNEQQTAEAERAVWGYTGGLIGVCFLYAIIHPIAYFVMYQLSYRLRVVLNIFIYDKVLRLKQYMLNETSSGEILNMVSIDLGKFDFVGMFLTFFLIAPFYFAGKAVCSYFIIGWPGVVGCAFFLVLIPVQLSFTRLFAKFRVKSADVADERVKLMREIIDGIRVIKMYVWEASFAKVIRKLRAQEVKELIKMHVLNGINYGINAGAPQFVVMTTILISLYYQKRHLLPEEVFAYISLMVDVRFYAQMFTLALPYLAEVKIAFNRIQRLIDISEVPEHYIIHAIRFQTEMGTAYSVADGAGDNPATAITSALLNDNTRKAPDVPLSEVSKGKGEKEPKIVSMNNLFAVHESSASDTNTGFCLRNLNFSVSQGELTMIVGASGCGKSSVLQCILDEMVVLCGQKKVQGSVAYAAQEAWIMAGSVRDNITFGLPYEAEKYNDVITACSLTRDFEIMQFGDRTIVGERGAGLSGGQKARIGLARAVYRDADIVLLDDPLSAVDTKVSQHLFSQCIEGYLRDKVVMLATHQTQYVPFVKQIVVLEDGEMLGCGTAEELAEKGIDIGELTATELQKEVPEPEKRVPLENIMDHAHTGFVDIDDKFDEKEGDFVYQPYTEEMDHSAVTGNSRAGDIDSNASAESIVKSFSTSEDSMGRVKSYLGRWAPKIDVASIALEIERAQPQGPGRMSLPVARKRKLPQNLLVKRSSIGAVNSWASLPMYFADTGGLPEDSTVAAVQDPGVITEEASSQLKTSIMSSKVRSTAKDTNTLSKTQEPPKDHGVEAEKTGHVKPYLYVHLFRVSGPVAGTLLIIFLGILAIATQITADRILASWSQANLRIYTTQHIVEVSRLGEPSTGVSPQGEPILVRPVGPKRYDWEYMRIYITFIAVFVFLNMISSAMFCVILARASQEIHDRMFRRMLRVVTKFFDDHPSGQILNKFSKDVGIVDIDLNRSFFDFSRLAYMVLGYFIAIALSSGWVLFISIPFLICILILRMLFLPASRAVKRKEAIARSPIYTHISVTLANICSIHAYECEDRMRGIMIDHVDTHTGFWFLFVASSRWFGTVVDIAMAFFETGVFLLGTSFAIYNVNNFASSSLGFMIYYTFALLVICQYMLRQSCEVDILMTSVERIRDYYDLPIEEDSKDVIDPGDEWPRFGNIELRHASLKYDSKDGTAKYALKDLSIIINHGEKIGVCGRTGAGKSSLVVLLTRLFELAEGQVLIDGVDCSTLSFARLRRSISIIPQDPVLFSRTVRQNLDPFNEYTDEEIEDALSRVEMLEPLERLPHGLDTMVAEGGSNFSVGQRQLLCLARALIDRNNILLVDEATANVDYATDELIQRTLRQVFKDATVLTIAHRLNTILDSTRIIVLDAGKIVECGSPDELKLNPDGFFYNLLQNADEDLS